MSCQNQENTSEAGIGGNVFFCKSVFSFTRLAGDEGNVRFGAKGSETAGKIACHVFDPVIV